MENVIFGWNVWGSGVRLWRMILMISVIVSGLSVVMFDRCWISIVSVVIVMVSISFGSSCSVWVGEERFVLMLVMFGFSGIWCRMRFVF